MISVLYIVLQANAKLCGDISQSSISPLYIVPLRFATSCVFGAPSLSTLGNVSLTPFPSTLTFAGPWPNELWMVDEVAAQDQIKGMRVNCLQVGTRLAPGVGARGGAL